MQTQSVKRSDTFFYSEFLKDYLEGDGLNHLRTYAPNKNSILEAIKGKEKFSLSKRQLLADDLQTQYQESEIDLAGTAVFENIERLRTKNTFTITTGQQIHIGLGPLYVLYKTFDVLANVEKLSKEYPKYNFVPVFWMASEDHDLEEIREVPVFGKKFFWETNQGGPVGRMNPSGVSEMFQSIKEEFRFSEDQLLFIDVCQKAYDESDSLSIAFRKILHHYFKKDGLVILDADSRSLKSSFIPVMNDELAHENYSALLSSTNQLEDAGYKKQLLIRECNLFRIQKGERTKILEKVESPSIDREESYSLSPNAALRPLYQEWILPNIIYVGGQSEVKYWMQLKGVFDNYSMPMPIVQVRTSAIMASEKQFVSSGIDHISTFFKSDSEINSLLSYEFKVLNESLDSIHGEIEQAINSYADIVKRELNGFSLQGKIKKLRPKILELKNLTSRQLDLKFDSNHKVKKALKFKTKFFNADDIQERKEHVLSHTYLLENTKLWSVPLFGIENQRTTLVYLF